MLKIIQTLSKATRPAFMNTVMPAAATQKPALTGTPAAGTFVQPREEILLDDLITIPAGATGRVIEATC